MLSLLTWWWVFLLLSTAAASTECPNNLFPGCKCEKTSDGYRVVCQEKHDLKKVKKFLGLKNAESFQVKVKDLMEKEAAASASSTSLSSSTASPLDVLNFSGDNMLSSVHPSLVAQANGAGIESNGYWGSFTDTIPALRNIPGFPTVSSGVTTGDHNLDMAIAHFSEPIVRFTAASKPAIADASKPVPADVHQMTAKLSDVVNLPVIGDIDISQLPPELLIYILHGNKLLGIPRSSSENLIRQYAIRVYEAAVRSKEGHPLMGDEKYLPSIHDASDELIDIFWEGTLLAPYLSPHQIQIIQEHYDAKFAAEGESGNYGIGPTIEFTLLNVLPPNYNLSKIPREVIQQVLSGQMPDFSLLPPDFLDYLRSNRQQLVDKFKGLDVSSLEKIFNNLQKYDLAQHDATTTPSDVNKVDAELVLKDEGWMTSNQFRIFATSVIAFFVVAAIVFAAFFIYYVRKSVRVGPEAFF